jgi:spore coat protein A, manganese oxidase
MPIILKSSDKWRVDNQLKSTVRAVSHSSSYDSAHNYTVTLEPILHDFHPKLRNIPMWSYGKQSPGLLIDEPIGQAVRVAWVSHLKNSSLSAILDFGERQGMERPHMLAVPHNQVHLHGARVAGTSDGFPEHTNAFHPNEGRIYYYPNLQSASTLWYHDHTMDVTRLNVYAGLFGMYVLRAPSEATVLPSGQQEIFLVLQDKSFSDAGKKLRYEQVDGTPEFKGDYPVVNSQVWPTKTLRPRIIRLRLVNGANARFFQLSLTTSVDLTTKIPLHIIGTEGGFLPQPVPIDDFIFAPGERMDVLVDLRGFAGQKLILRNSAGFPFQGVGGAALPATENTAELLEFIVKGSKSSSDAVFDPATIALPSRIDPFPFPASIQAFPDRAQFVVIEAACDAAPALDLTVNLTIAGVGNVVLRRFTLAESLSVMPTSPAIESPTVKVNGELWDTPATAINAEANALEVWEFINTTGDTHPMHVHLVQFQMMSRRTLDAVTVAAPLEKWEEGWKDTAQCHPNQMTRLIMRFDGYQGHYVYHCHILEHEDMGMMYPFEVGG